MSKPFPPITTTRSSCQVTHRKMPDGTRFHPTAAETLTSMPLRFTYNVVFFLVAAMGQSCPTTLHHTSNIPAIAAKPASGHTLDKCDSMPSGANAAVETKSRGRLLADGALASMLPIVQSRSHRRWWCGGRAHSNPVDERCSLHRALDGFKLFEAELAKSAFLWCAMTCPKHLNNSVSHLDDGEVVPAISVG